MTATMVALALVFLLGSTAARPPTLPPHNTHLTQDQAEVAICPPGAMTTATLSPADVVILDASAPTGVATAVLPVPIDSSLSCQLAAKLLRYSVVVLQTRAPNPSTWSFAQREAVRRLPWRAKLPLTHYQAVEAVVSEVMRPLIEQSSDQVSPEALQRRIFEIFDSAGIEHLENGIPKRFAVMSL